jgi:large conductance mechanosensitive channel
MKIINEFKEFAMRGNVVDLAVGVIIGAAFGAIVKSVVDDLVMPLVGKALGNADFTNFYIPLSDKIQKIDNHWPALADAKKLGPVFAYGNFLTTTLNFLIIAFCIFLMVKGINALKRKEEAKPVAAPGPTTQEKLLMEIRDALVNRSK